jgi:hypothetical protein
MVEKWIITIKKVRSFCGICEITYKSSLQPQTLTKLIPVNYDHKTIHETLTAAADSFYMEKYKNVSNL